MNNQYLRQEGSVVFMCCGKAGCPSVKINDDGMVEITDEKGNKVIMQKDEAALLPQAVEKLNAKANWDSLHSPRSPEPRETCPRQPRVLSSPGKPVLLPGG